MEVATLPNTVVSELSLERPKAPGLEVLNLENATCLSSNSAIYSTAGQTEPAEAKQGRVTNCKSLHSEFKVLGLKERTRIEAWFVSRASWSAVKEEKVVDDVGPAAFKILPEAAKDAMSIVLDEMKSVGVGNGVDVWDNQEERKDLSFTRVGQ